MTLLERVVEELVAEGRRGRHMYNAEQNAALDDEARAFYRRVLSRYEAALKRHGHVGGGLVCDFSRDFQEALATEAGTAETVKQGFVHEGAGLQGNAQTQSPSTPDNKDKPNA